MKKVFACLLAVCMVLPAMAGCSQPQETTVVRLSEVTHSVFYAPQYVAISQGFFADEGLTVELNNGGGADKVMTAVVSGQAAIGLAGPEASIYVAQQGKEARFWWAAAMAPSAGRTCGAAPSSAAGPGACPR